MMVGQLVLGKWISEGSGAVQKSRAEWLGVRAIWLSRQGGPLVTGGLREMTAKMAALAVTITALERIGSWPTPVTLQSSWCKLGDRSLIELAESHSGDTSPDK